MEHVVSLLTKFLTEFFNTWPIFATIITLVLLFFVIGKISKTFIKPLIKGLIIGANVGGILAISGVSPEFCLVAGVVLFLGSAVYDLLKTIIGAK